MRRVCRGICPAAAVLPIAMLPSPALADGGHSVSLTVDRSAWTWQHLLPVGVLPVDEPSQVPAGDLAVASDASGKPSKATYLHVDLGALPSQASVRTFTVVLPVDTDAQNVDPGRIRLEACTLLGDFAPGEGTDAAAAPMQDCTGAAQGRYDPTAKTWTFALAPYAQQWVSVPASAHGIVVRSPADYAPPDGAPFQLSFLGADQVGVEATYDEPLVPAAPALPAPQMDAGGLVAAPPVSSGTTTLDVPSVAPAVAQPAVPPVTAAAPVTAPAVVAAPVMRRRLLPPRTSGGALWALACLGGLLLTAVSRVVANTDGPRRFAEAERDRLDRIRLVVGVEGVATAPAAARRPTRQTPQIRQGRRPMSSATSTVT